jgi:preprotein translocase subunit SecY
MQRISAVSNKTRVNWLIDAAVFLGALIASLTGIYFLFLPSGGYQGGRNPAYGITILFSRATWDDLHTWGGIAMIAAAVIHFSIHWGWVKTMAKRMAAALSSRAAHTSRGARINLLVDAVIALSFLAAAVSGIYFLFVPAGGYQGGAVAGWDPGLLFSRATWDLIHTWSGVVMIAAAVIHFAIHWGWVKRVTAKVFAAPQKQAAGLSATQVAGQS